MKNILTVLLSIATLSCYSQVFWQIDHEQSKVTFHVKNMGMRVYGAFEQFNASVQTVQPDQFQDALIEFNVSVKSINTKNKMRDRDLMKKDWFDADNFANMTFKSNSFKAEGDHYVLTGLLNIKGTSREETFIVKPVGTIKNKADKTFAYFTTEKKIDRSKFGLRSGFSVSNDVNIRLDILLTR